MRFNKLARLFIAATAPLHGQPVILVDPPRGTAAAQLQEDPYTRYELLEPGSGKFRILYDVTAHDARATSYFNPIRKGSIASNEHVTDLATGKRLTFRVIDGNAAKAAGLKDADPAGEYLQVTRPARRRGGAHLHRQDL